MTQVAGSLTERSAAMDRYRGFGFTMVEDENVELQDKNGQP